MNYQRLFPIVLVAILGGFLATSNIHLSEDPDADFHETVELAQMNAQAAWVLLDLTKIKNQDCVNSYPDWRREVDPLDQRGQAAMSSVIAAKCASSREEYDRLRAQLLPE